jgi:hypothetical protein
VIHAAHLRPRSASRRATTPVSTGQIEDVLAVDRADHGLYGRDHHLAVERAVHRGVVPGGNGIVRWLRSRSATPAPARRGHSPTKGGALLVLVRSCPGMSRVVSTYIVLM